MSKREYDITAQYNTDGVKEISVDWNGYSLAGRGYYGEDKL